MLSTIVLAVCSFGLSLVLTPLARELARRRCWFDHPDNNRKQHAAPIPRIGGVAILLAFAGSLGVVALGNVPGSSASAVSLVGKLLPASVFIFALGLLDDLIGLTARQKLFGQTIAAGFACASGIHFGNFADGALAGYAGVLLTVLWLVGCANAFNLIDGADGLAGGIGLIAATAILGAAFLYRDAQLATAAVPLAGALLAFLLFNFHPASIFLGDSGSLWVGFTLGGLSVIWSQKAQTLPGMVAPAVALSIPLLDMALSIARRFLRRQPIFHGDRDHIHHRLLDRGFSPNRVAWVLYLASALAGCIALFQSTALKEVAWVAIVLWCVLVWIGTRVLRYREFGIAARLFLQSSLRSSVKANLALLRCEESLTGAQDAEQCWWAIRTVSRECGFSAAAFRLGRWTYHDQLDHAAGRYLLHIPLSDAGYVQLMCRASRSGEPAVIGPLVDLLQEVLSAKSARFSSVQVTPKKHVVASPHRTSQERIYHGGPLRQL